MGSPPVNDDFAHGHYSLVPWRPELEAEYGKIAHALLQNAFFHGNTMNRLQEFKYLEPLRKT
ncbi:unnamed protein product [Dovyalis caffra]|uniref:Uncharacterized protein n=1 Tax=Dovyalis caffra TaxID=77055 RepID=A0AAV1S6G7_9ROSI|nr:unnamed protein product [Dovyalis caffra]